MPAVRATNAGETKRQLAAGQISAKLTLDEDRQAGTGGVVLADLLEEAIEVVA